MGKKKKGGTLARPKRDVTSRCDNKTVTCSRGASKHPVRERVVAFLEANAPMEFNPKFISLKTKATFPSVRQAIKRELESPLPKIVHVRRGWYRAAFNIDRLRSLTTTKRIGLHGIKLEGKCHNANTGYSLASQSTRKYRKRGIYPDSFNGRVVTITVHSKGLVELWLKTSKNPLGFEEFDKFCYWVYGMFSGVVLEHTWKLSQLGINVDTEVLELDGFKKLSLKHWRNAWFQIYQKEKGLLRQEFHLMPDLKLQDALTIMHGIIHAHNEGQYTPPPEDENDPRWHNHVKHHKVIAEHGEATGACLAIETGPETAAVLKTFLDEIGLPKGLGVNFDPANLVMVCREDIPKAVETLGPYIVHTHAKDGVSLKPMDAETRDAVFHGDKPEGFNMRDYISEVPLGEGGVDFPTYLPALRKTGFDGYLTIEREVGDDPRRDIEQAVRFLKELLS